jgi:predicted nucleic acid-binding protein
LDTNVLASAFGTRGLCADVLRLILAEHQLVTGEPVIAELRGVLRRKFGIPPATVGEIEAILRKCQVVPTPRQLPNLPLHDTDDLLVLGSALDAGAEIFVTGDRELLELKERPQRLRISSPREFWNIASSKSRRGR